MTWVPAGIGPSEVARHSSPRILTIPTDAVRGAATPAPWVLVVDGGVAVRRDVVLGITGEGQSEIQSGISEGTLVVLATEGPFEPAQRVRTRQVE